MQDKFTADPFGPPLLSRRQLEKLIRCGLWACALSPLLCLLP